MAYELGSQLDRLNPQLGKSPVTLYAMKCKLVSLKDNDWQAFHIIVAEQYYQHTPFMAGACRGVSGEKTVKSSLQLLVCMKIF